MSEVIKLRTITYFLSGAPKTDAEWETEICKAATFLQSAAEDFEAKGYEIQTLRIATRALALSAAAGNEDEPLRVAHMLEALTAANGLSFLNLGTCSEDWLLNKALISLGSTLQHTSFSFSWKQHMGLSHARRLATVILKIAQLTEGSGNFRFGVAFNCEGAQIPFFPAAHPGELSGFALGTENSGLVHKAFKQAAAKMKQGVGNLDECIALALRKEMTAAFQPLEQLAMEVAGRTGVPYLGLDASVVPGLEGPNLTDSYELLGLGQFGGSGTLAVSERITAAIKSLPVKLTGFSGLMLPVTEDRGLAEAAAVVCVII